MIVELPTAENLILPFDFEIRADEIDLDDEPLKLKDSIKVEGEIKKGIVQTDVRGKISAEIALECTRCLQGTEQNFEISFAAAFVTPEHYTQAKEAELNTDDLDVSVFEGDLIDLTELVREQILLNLPEQVFCREGCKGLCEKCGANRNLIDCKCIEKEVDPRWAALKNLK
ncbi:MAG: DUF177 domain-containing protein [Actinomycetota bacterium]